MEESLFALSLKTSMVCLRMCVSYNVHEINSNLGQGVGDRAMLAFDTNRVVIECLLVPGYWLVQSWNHFPDLWSVRNTCLAISQGQKLGDKKAKTEKRAVLIPRKPLIQVRIEQDIIYQG